MCGGSRSERVPSHPPWRFRVTLAPGYTFFALMSVRPFTCLFVRVHLPVFLSYLFFFFVCLFVCPFSAPRSVSATHALVSKVDIHSPSRIHMQVYAGVLGAPSVWGQVHLGDIKRYCLCVGPPHGREWFHSISTGGVSLAAIPTPPPP